MLNRLNPFKKDKSLDRLKTTQKNQRIKKLRKKPLK